MFDYLRQKIDTLPSVSPQSRRTVKGLARYEAACDCAGMVLALGEIKRERRLTRAAREMIPKFEAAMDATLLPAVDRYRVPSYTSPYPDYPEYAEDKKTILHRMNDRMYVDTVLHSDRINMADVEKWLSSLKTRDDLSHGADVKRIDTIADGLRGAKSFHEYRQIFEKEAIPYLTELLPLLKEDPQKSFKKTLAKELFDASMSHNDAGGHVVACKRSSTAMTEAIFHELVDAGGKVIITAPYFEQFPIMIDEAHAKTIAADTTTTDFKLTGAHLRKLIAENAVGKGDWLFMTAPNNVNMQPYTKKELQEIANVVAQSGIRVISDELYARVGRKKHHMLTNMTGVKEDGTEVAMKDQVITVSGCSKQYPFGSHERRKLGAGLFASKQEAETVNRYLQDISCDVFNNQAIVYQHCLQNSSAKDRRETRLHAVEDLAEVKQVVGALNAAFKEPFGGREPVILHASKAGYLAGLELSSEVCEKVGIKGSQDLMSYLLMTTRQTTRSLDSEGVDQPIVRVNVHELAGDIDAFKARMSILLDSIASGIAPQMKQVDSSLNTAIRNNIVLEPEALRREGIKGAANEFSQQYR